MRCPVCGTNGVENGVCFYCEARKVREKRRAEPRPKDPPSREPAPPHPDHPD